jgi:hypothetical protein
MNRNSLPKLTLYRQVLPIEYLLVVNSLDPMPENLMDNFVQRIQEEISNINVSSGPTALKITTLQDEKSNGKFLLLIITSENLGSEWLEDHARNIIVRLLSNGYPRNRPHNFRVKVLAEARAGC